MNDDETGMVLMPRGNVQDMFDIIVGSLDFGSGFLDQEQIEMLRSVAELLGVNPMQATPYQYTKSYPHKFEAAAVWANAGPLPCRYCSSAFQSAWHEEAGGSAPNG